MASINFINECKKRANANRLGKIIIEENGLNLTQSDQLQNFLINDGCYIEGSIIGSVYIKNLTASFVDTNNIDLLDKKIKAQIGVKYGDSTTEYIDMGKYTIERPTDEITANMSQITAYDDLLNNIDNKYVCNIDYSAGGITLKDLYIDVCTQLELSPKTTVFLNNDIPITANPFGGDETNRIVLQTIAKIACSFVTIDNETNEIDLSWLSTNEEPDYTFEKSDYSTLTGGTITYGPVNSVTIKNSTVDDENVTQTDDTSIEQNGEHSVVIEEDYILYSAELREQAIAGIFERLNGLKYVDTELITYYGKPFLKMGDKIRIITDDGYVDTYVLLHDFMYDGTFYSCIKSPVLTEQEVKTKQNTSLSEALRNVQIQVNKQTGEIKSMVVEATNTVNEQKDIVSDLSTTLTETNSSLNTLQQSLTTIRETMLVQTSETFEMLFKETGIEDTINTIEEALKDVENQQNTITEYIRFDGAKITLGKSSSPVKLIIENDIIKFVNGDEDKPSAYISENQLYITDSTILNKLQIGRWETKPDSLGNLNTRWIG